MNFKQTEEKIQTLNSINPNASYARDDEYHKLFWEIYEDLVKLDEAGKLVRQDPNPISYLEEYDGFCYIIKFRPKFSRQEYEIGVCDRGRPYVKPVK